VVVVVVVINPALTDAGQAISFQWGLVDPKFQVEGVAPHQPFFFSEN